MRCPTCGYTYNRSDSELCFICNSVVCNECGTKCAYCRNILCSYDIRQCICGKLICPVCCMECGCEVRCIKCIGKLYNTCNHCFKYTCVICGNRHNDKFSYIHNLISDIPIKCKCGYNVCQYCIDHFIPCLVCDEPICKREKYYCAICMYYMHRSHIHKCVSIKFMDELYMGNTIISHLTSLAMNMVLKKMIYFRRR